MRRGRCWSVRLRNRAAELMESGHGPKHVANILHMPESNTKKQLAKFRGSMVDVPCVMQTRIDVAGDLVCVKKKPCLATLCVDKHEGRAGGGRHAWKEAQNQRCQGAANGSSPHVPKLEVSRQRRALCVPLVVVIV